MAPPLQAAGLNQATRPARRLYVGGLPTPCFDYQLQVGPPAVLCFACFASLFSFGGLPTPASTTSCR